MGWGAQSGGENFSPYFYPHRQQTQEISDTLGCLLGWLMGRVQDRVGEGGPWGLGLTFMKGLYFSLLMLFPNVCYKLTCILQNFRTPRASGYNVF